jgi:hypothetical protein
MNEPEIEIGSENVFRDLDLPDAAVLRLRSGLVILLHQYAGEPIGVIPPTDDIADLVRRLERHGIVEFSINFTPNS